MKEITYEEEGLGTPLELGVELLKSLAKQQPPLPLGASSRDLVSWCPRPWKFVPGKVGLGRRLGRAEAPLLAERGGTTSAGGVCF